LLPCEMQMMQISLISYNGIDLSFIFFELPSVFLCLPWNVIKLQVLPSWYTSGESYFILWCWSSYFHLKVQVYMLTSLREAWSSFISLVVWLTTRNLDIPQSRSTTNARATS
jgi:hypothetical protein